MEEKKICYLLTVHCVFSSTQQREQNTLLPRRVYVRWYSISTDFFQIKYRPGFNKALKYRVHSRHSICSASSWEGVVGKYILKRDLKDQSLKGEQIDKDIG